MSRVCDICGKRSLTGNHRSHSMNASKRKFYPNLQTVKAEMDGGVKKVKVCTSCLRSNRVKKAL
jgi:large subunit ribosomal protein L28